MLQFNQFDKATIKKEFYTNNIKYLQLQYTDEETDKIYVIKISYKRYLLQKYLGYLIPKEHHVISLDGNEENYEVYNLGIRDEDDDSPIYKGWKITSVIYRGGRSKDKVIRIKNNNKNKKLQYHHYLYANYLGREILKDEKFHFKDNERTNLDVTNFLLKRPATLNSYIYPDAIVKGPYYENPKAVVRIINKKGSFRLSYSRFIYQEYIGRILTSEEYVELIEPNLYTIENLLLKQIPILTSIMYPAPTYKVYGPYFNNQNRRKVDVWDYKSQKCKIVVYSRFLMQEHLGRFLTKEEEIHHIDGNYLHDQISNYQLLNRHDHMKLHHTHLIPVNLKCQICGESFILKNKTLSAAYQSLKRGHKGPFCSSSCAGKSRKFKNLLNLLPEKKYYHLQHKH